MAAPLSHHDGGGGGDRIDFPGSEEDEEAESWSSRSRSGSAPPPPPASLPGSPAESLESFSNLPSYGPSSSDLNSDSEEGGREAGRAAASGEGEAAAGSTPGLAATAAAAAAVAPAAAAASPSAVGPPPWGWKEPFPGQSVYHLKWVRWKEENTPVVTQNENGPCPLLAIMNVLLLAWKVRVGHNMQSLCAWAEYLAGHCTDAASRQLVWGSRSFREH